MVALLGMLAGALVIGRLARRIDARVELALLGLIAVIVLVELASWSPAGSGGPLSFVRELASALW